MKHTVQKNKTATKPITKTTSKPSATTEKCLPSKTLVNGQNACTRTLIFEENFDVLDSSKWQREVRIPLDTESAEFLSYQNRSENSFVKDGKLFIKPTLLSDLEEFTDERIRTGELVLEK